MKIHFLNTWWQNNSNFNFCPLKPLKISDDFRDVNHFDPEVTETEVHHLSISKCDYDNE